MTRYWVMAAFLMVPLSAAAGDVAVVQLAGRTTVGTKDFTVSGFGTPKAVMCVSSYGVTNGTRVAHAGVTIGFSDGVRQHTAFVRSKDAVTTTLTGRRANTTDLLYYADADGATIGRVQFASWITDGVRLNWSAAPATAYQVSCTLFGGAGISNAYVNTVSAPSTIDTSTTVTTVGFLPDVLIGVISGEGTYNDSNQSQGDLSVGYAIRGGPQKAIGTLDVTGLTTTALNHRHLSNRIGRSGTSAQQVEIQNFTPTGFDATTRNAGTPSTVGYLALHLNGLTATGLEVDSPTATGSRSITGITGTPQWGMLVAGAAQGVDSTVTDTDAEAWGLSTFTASAQSCVGISSDDAVATTNVETIIDATPICLVKDDANFYHATFTSFSAGTATFNYSAASGTVRKWIGLFLSDSAASAFGRLRRRDP